MKISQAYSKSKSWLLPWQPYSIPSKSKLDYPSSLANWGGKGFIFLPFCEWLSLRKVVLSNFWNCFNLLVAVVHFHYRLFLDFTTIFVEIKLPILLYYWITYFFKRGDEKFLFFRRVQAILGRMQQTQWLSSKGNSCCQVTLKQQKLLLEILFFLHLFIYTKR